MEEDFKIVGAEDNSKVLKKVCPNCGSTDIEFNPITRKLRCNYCRTEFKREQLQGFVENIEELEGKLVGSGAQDIKQDNNLIICKCTGCGAEIVINSSEVATAKCHWCHTSLSLSSQVISGVVQDAILPFKVTKEEAFEDMKKEVDKRKFFIDKNFKETFSIENLKGVYLPFMMLDVNAHADFKGKGGNVGGTHKVTRTKGGFVNTADGRERTQIEYEVEEYDIHMYDVEREFDIQIKDMLEIAEEKQINWKKVKKPDRAAVLLNTLMPFDTHRCVKWDANYIRGYAVEKRDVNISNISDRMYLKARDVARSKINEDLDYTAGVKWEKEDFTIKGQQWKTIYLPVWIYSYSDKNKSYSYILAENGRTKKLNYNIPLNRFRIFPFIPFCIILPVAIAFMAVLMKYSHWDYKYSHEKSAKANINILNRVDDFIKTKKNQKYDTIDGANNNRIDVN